VFGITLYVTNLFVIFNRISSDAFYATDVAWVEDLAGRSVLVVSGSDGKIRVLDDNKLFVSSL
jgi:hypothetical protein